MFARARAVGIATDVRTGEDYRSAMIQVLEKTNESEREYKSKGGFLLIATGDERVRYEIVPESWNVAVAEDHLTFLASGLVEDENGEQYEVNLEGYFARHTRLGNFWSIEGTFQGHDLEYELHYVGISHAGLRW